MPEQGVKSLLNFQKRHRRSLKVWKTGKLFQKALLIVEKVTSCIPMIKTVVVNEWIVVICGLGSFFWHSGNKEEFYTQDFTFYFSVFFQMEMSVRDSKGSINWKIVAILDYYTFERNEGPCDSLAN